MKFIIENKVYDTEKSEEVFKANIKTGKSKFFGREIDLYAPVVILKTEKGSWWYRTVDITTIERVGCLEIEEVKDVLMELNEVEVYECYFGKLEEA